MKVLVVGGGGREHALAWKFAAERGVTEVLCAPGNAGIARIVRCVPADVADPASMLALAEREQIDLTVVGPELPLDRGIADLFASKSRMVFGPTRAAAQLECSKVFAKTFMSRHGIPTAHYRTCETTTEAMAVIARGELGFPLVVKADGIAAGKGVVVAADRHEAEAAVRAAMDDRQFGDAGARVVFEECLSGPEVSFFAISDGQRAVPLATAQDHKRVFDDDKGPNTGGMGAFAPSPLIDEGLESRVMREIVEPVVTGLRAEGREYRGFLYVGLMLTYDGPRVIEFNVRFGDPEAQVVIPMIADDLAPRLAAAAGGALDAAPLKMRSERHVGVVLASQGYPQSGPIRLPITGLDDAACVRDVLVFHAATANEHVPGAELTLTAGGRVLTVVGRGATYEDAVARAYEGVSKITFPGMHYRRDIGAKACVRSPS
ncbi:MAG: phosphoribosylamine--glycine ligase [Acidobacteria bacterium]|nr:phosphoribosylamine--glycine ligase [Acidobacteriota bacterium]MCA1649423.1 phosphoribosylamine--glycine ligase [Acidobacteriota bacterium]